MRKKVKTYNVIMIDECKNTHTYFNISKYFLQKVVNNIPTLKIVEVEDVFPEEMQRLKQDLYWEKVEKRYDMKNFVRMKSTHINSSFI